MLEKQVTEILTSLSSRDGEDFISSFLLSVARVIRSDHLFVASVDRGLTQAHSIAYIEGDHVAENFTYELENTPCADITANEVCYYNGNIQEQYPDDLLLVAMEIASYIGIPLTNSDGKVQGILVALYKSRIENLESVRSIFELFSSMISSEMERKLQKLKVDLNQSIFNALDEGVIITNAQRRILYANPSFLHSCGFPKEEVIGNEPGALLHSSTQSENFYQDMWQEVQEKGHWSGEILNRRKSGKLYSGWLKINKTRDEATGNTYYIGIYLDMQEILIAKKQIEKRENFDILTGIANRHWLAKELEKLLQSPEIESGHQSLGLIDVNLDNFRDLNAKQGYEVGDQILINTAQIIDNQLGENQFLTRVSGDEFIVLVTGTPTIDSLKTLAEKLLEDIRQPFQIDEKSIEVTASIGIAIAPENGKDVTNILAAVDRASRKAKKLGKNQIETI
ncbi:GGDEF domain-containing protein [Aliikangiella sp. G2MR2-5]|uniref:sensor domain-containing diguanylate cyclase n=1 Tax=Aliikangiella sp. G2MR2-5 TaxID=2788943 RepID=UPI0018AB5CC4|nr:GGDEF domain-containing protein [Aliikangiella sp. G2MR2-5]